MSFDRQADAHQKLKLATDVVIAFINSSKPSPSNGSADKPAKETSSNLPSDERILDLLEKTFEKMNELAPLQERKVGLGK